jgi:hypothetical protein
MSEIYVTLSEVSSDLIADAPIPWWKLVSFLAEDSAEQAVTAAAERGCTIDRAGAVATGATRLHDDAVHDVYRKGDGVIRIAWPVIAGGGA